MHSEIEVYYSHSHVLDRRWGFCTQVHSYNLSDIQWNNNYGKESLEIITSLNNNYTNQNYKQGLVDLYNCCVAQNKTWKLMDQLINLPTYHNNYHN
jgi:hypothetical protein